MALSWYQHRSRWSLCSCLRVYGAVACLILCACLFLPSCVTLDDGRCLSGVLSPKGQCQPYRTTVFALNEEKELAKPLASFPFAGFALSDDLLIGELKRQWLAAFSLKSHNVKWWLKLESEVASPVQVFGSWAVLGLRNGMLIKVDTRLGKIIWNVDLGRFYHRRPALSGETLIVQGVDNKVFAIDFTRGRKLWVHDAGAPNQLSIRASAAPVVADRHVFVGLSSGEVQIINIETGQLLRRLNLPLGGFRFHDVIGDLVIQQDHVLFAKYDGSLGRVPFRSSTTAPKWKRTFSSISTTTYREGLYYIGCTNGDLYAIDAMTGQDKWRLSTGEAIVSIVTSEKVLFVTGSRGQVSAVQAATGSLDWVDHLSGTISEQPIFFGDQVFFASGLDTLYGYKVR